MFCNSFSEKFQLFSDKFERSLRSCFPSPWFRPRVQRKWRKLSKKASALMSPKEREKRDILYLHLSVCQFERISTTSKNWAKWARFSHLHRFLWVNLQRSCCKSSPETGSVCALFALKPFICSGCAGANRSNLLAENQEFECFCKIRTKSCNTVITFDYF